MPNCYKYGLTRERSPITIHTMNKNRFNMRMDPVLRDKLRLMAYLEKSSMTEVVERLIREEPVPWFAKKTNQVGTHE